MSRPKTAMSSRVKTIVRAFGLAHTLFLLGTSLLVILACSANAYAQVPVYTVTDLGVISGDDASGRYQHQQQRRHRWLLVHQYCSRESSLRLEQRRIDQSRARLHRPCL